jgi:hypothetical protein
LGAANIARVDLKIIQRLQQDQSQSLDDLRRSGVVGYLKYLCACIECKARCAKRLEAQAFDARVADKLVWSIHETDIMEVSEQTYAACCK